MNPHGSSFEKGPANPCPICHSEPSERFSAKYVTVLKCGAPSCGHLYAENPAPGHGLHAHDADEEYLHYRERNARLVRAWRKIGFLSPDSEVLDVGSGVGHIVESIREQMPGVLLTCMELERSSAEYLRSKGFDVVDSFEQLDRRFDAVLLIEVIEHASDPVGLLSSCRRVMTPSAQAIVTTPCGETRLGNRKTSAYETREHIQFFTEASLQLACRNAGFAGFDFRYMKEMYPLGRGIGALTASLKSIARPVENRLTGPRHLTGFARQ